MAKARKRVARDDGSLMKARRIREVTSSGSHSVCIPSASLTPTMDHRMALSEVKGEIFPHSDTKGWGAQLRETFGTASHSFAIQQLSLLADAINARPGGENTEIRVNSVLAVVSSISAKDEIEAMLGVQMAATHAAAMKCLGRLQRAEQILQFEANGTMVIKLMRTYTAQVEALAKLRRGGEQTVRVEHVHVHAGGQAVVGNVATRLT